MLLEKKAWVCFAEDEFVCLHDFLELDFDKVVERVDVLLDKTLDLEKRRKKFPFVLAHYWPVYDGNGSRGVVLRPC